MKIAICDDFREDIRYLKGLIRSSKQCPPNTVFFEYTSGEELLRDYQNFNVVFLDMQMGGMDGKETAERIRSIDPEVILSFYSGFEVAAHKILNTRPSSYMIKGTGEKKLSAEIDMVLTEALSKKHKVQIKIQYYDSVCVLDLQDVLYISINNKGSEVWLTKEKANEIIGAQDRVIETSLKSNTSLKAYYESLKDCGFIYASRSYIVNAENVVAQQQETLILKGGAKLNLTRGMKKTFEEEFSNYWNLKYNRGRLKE